MRLSALKELLKKAKLIASELKRQDEVLIVTHIDADGITSGAIAHAALLEVGIESKVRFVKQLDSTEIERIADENVFVWFTDLGSGQLSRMKNLNGFVITDHHQPEMSCEMQLNPHDFGFDGSGELSGAGTTYIVARYVVGRRGNILQRLSQLAIVGAVGDLQDSRDGKLRGINRVLARESTKLGGLRVVRDIRFFGKQTRPAFKMLEYTFEPFIPGVSGNESGAKRFLTRLGVNPALPWVDFSREEKRRVVSNIVKICMRTGTSFKTIMRIVGDSYILLSEPEKTEKRDAMEYSTLLNATARYSEAEIGLRVCMGDEGAYKRARTLLQNHRRNLSNGVRFVGDSGIVEMGNIQYFHAGSNIPDTIVGIVAGMCFPMANREKPIVAFAKSDNGVKVSARGTHKLVRRGLNLAEALRAAALRVGGEGGGHNVAAGATIPDGREEEFLRILDEIVGKQIGKQG